MGKTLRRASWGVCVEFSSFVLDMLFEVCLRHLSREVENWVYKV